MVGVSALAPAGAWNPLCEVKHNDARPARPSPAAVRSCARLRRVDAEPSRLRIPVLPPGRRGVLTDTRQLDPEAAEGLNSLYRRYAGWLDGRLRAHVDPDRAADVVQDTYLRAAPYRIGDIRHPRAFLLRIAMNLVRDESRRARRQSLAAEPAALAEAASQADQLLLKQIVVTMPPLYRDVFVLSRFGGMTYAEIAAARGLNVKTVEWRMSKALEHCVARLDD